MSPASWSASAPGPKPITTCAAARNLTPIVITEEVARDRAVMYQYLVGCAYLIIGLFVYFRRGSAQKATHFYVLCLASFIFLCFHYTGKFNSFDKVIYLATSLAGLLAPTVFLHFCLTFPEPRGGSRSRYGVALLYMPAALLFAGLYRLCFRDAEGRRFP